MQHFVCSAAKTQATRCAAVRPAKSDLFQVITEMPPQAGTLSACEPVRELPSGAAPPHGDP
jgi:hypothetical protein